MRVVWNVKQQNVLRILKTFCFKANLKRDLSTSVLQKNYQSRRNRRKKEFINGALLTKPWIGSSFSSILLPVGAFICGRFYF